MGNASKIWISSTIGTGQVNVDRVGIIEKTPPIWSKFIGQHYRSLMVWLELTTGEQIRFEWM